MRFLLIVILPILISFLAFYFFRTSFFFESIKIATGVFIGSTVTFYFTTTFYFYQESIKTKKEYNYTLVNLEINIITNIQNIQNNNRFFNLFIESTKNLTLMELFILNFNSKFDSVANILNLELKNIVIKNISSLNVLEINLKNLKSLYEKYEIQLIDIKKLDQTERYEKVYNSFNNASNQLKTAIEENFKNSIELSFLVLHYIQNESLIFKNTWKDRLIFGYHKNSYSRNLDLEVAKNTIKELKKKYNFDNSHYE